MKVALVHDWLTGMRGGERVLERICALFPDAPIFTLLWNRGSASRAIESHPIHTSFVQGLPEAATRYRWYLPLFPRAIAGFDLRGFDAVVSSSHCVAKGIRVPRGVFHLSYIHTPMRYVWDLESQYFPPGRFPWPVSAYIRNACGRLRHWDVATSGGPHALVANSSYVAERIRRYWGRESLVVHPPVETGRFQPARGARDYYLLAGAFAPYKRGDLAIEACRNLGRPLKVVGSGQEERRLRKTGGPTVEFLGHVADEEMARLYAGARALLFPGEEDFGIAPVEALASGCPVIAFGKGGVLETIGAGASETTPRELESRGWARVPGGVLFAEQSAASLARAIEAFEAQKFDASDLAARAVPFATARFDVEIRAVFETGYAAWRAGPPARAARVPVTAGTATTLDSGAGAAQAPGDATAR